MIFSRLNAIDRNSDRTFVLNRQHAIHQNQSPNISSTITLTALHNVLFQFGRILKTRSAKISEIALVD